jgi:polyisoprenyl-teichoic acid--peptidoglycan teichoic acid transferase
MSNKNILDGFVSRRSSDNTNGYKAPLTGTPAGFNQQAEPQSLSKKERKKVAKQAKSSDNSWQNKALKNSVLSGALVSDPLNKQSQGLADGTGKNKRSESKTKKQKLKRILKLSLIPILLLGGYYLFNFLNLSSKVFDGNPLGFLKSTKLRGESEGRVNILLAGTSEGDDNHPGERLTDSIMVISYTIETKKAAIISIPRDFWVKSEYGSSKINALYPNGEDGNFNEEGYYPGGIGLLQRELEDITGLDIHYYAKINYNAFKESVDAVGGIEVDIQGSDPRGIYDPNFDGEFGKDALKLKNGVQSLNGTQALLLARARNANGGYGLAGSDYDRAENQRKMLVALKNKALGVGIFANPLKINELTEAIGNNIVTDFKTGEARRIYDLAGDPETQIESVGLTAENVLKNYTSPGTGAALIPIEGIGNYSGVRKFIQEKVGPLRNPQSSNSDQQNLASEAATAVVLNAGATSGSAQKMADSLPAPITASTVSNATERVNGTKIVVLNQKLTSSKNELLQSLSATEHSGKTEAYLRLYPNADFVILVGKDS